MAPAHLTLFPSPAAGLPTRKTPSPNVYHETNLRGLAFQVDGTRKAHPQIQPAQETFQHSLFCNPAVAPKSPATVPTTTSPSTTTRGPIRRSSRTRRRSSPIIEGPDSVGEFIAREDQLSELPRNTHFGSLTPPRRSLSSASQRQRIQPVNTSMHRTPRAAHELITPVDDQDAVPPLPESTRFRSPSPKHGYPIDTSGQSPGFSAPMRSIFPQYNPTRALQHQSYYPTSSPPAYSSPVMSSPTQQQVLKRYDSAVGLVDGYEHIPAATQADSQALWSASTETFPCEGRKVQFPLYQDLPDETIKVAIGTSPSSLIYSMTRESPSGTTPKRYALQKHCPTTSSSPSSSSPVSQLEVPIENKNQDQITTIFPKTAAIAAIKAIAESPEARHIATFDPHGESPEAARLAQDAVTSAHRNYSCQLIKKQKSSNNKPLEAHYELKHPQLGVCAITVTTTTPTTAISRSGGSGEVTKMKISFHHPSATPAAIASETLNLAFLDFAHGACVLDLPSLIALDSRFVVDTVVSALVAVAVIENERFVREQTTFEGPPVQHAVVGGKMGKGNKKKMGKQQRGEGAATAVKTGKDSLPLQQQNPSSSSPSSSSSFLTRRREKKEVQELCATSSSPTEKEKEEVEEQKKQIQISRREAKKDDKLKQEKDEDELPGFTRAVFGLMGMGIKGSWWVAKTSVKVTVKGVKMVGKEMR